MKLFISLSLRRRTKKKTILHGFFFFFIPFVFFIFWKNIFHFPRYIYYIIIFICNIHICLGEFLCNFSGVKLFLLVFLHSVRMWICSGHYIYTYISRCNFKKKFACLYPYIKCNLLFVIYISLIS